MATAIAKRADVLRSPDLLRRTRKILALREKGKGLTRELFRVYADIGDELVAVKQKLDRNPEDKTAWMRWLRNHVRYTPRTARNYMALARWRREKGKRVSLFSRLPVYCLYRIAALDPKHRKRIKPHTRLLDPNTGKTQRVDAMSRRELDRALDHLEGHDGRGPIATVAEGGGRERKLPIPTPSGDRELPPSPRLRRTGPLAPTGGTREAFAAATREAILRLAREVPRDRVLPLAGKLSPDSKDLVLAAVRALRRTILKWPAYARGKGAPG